MQKILGCFKIVPDYELLSKEDWVADENNLVDAGFAKTIWNCFDESALEMMLRLSAQAEGLGMNMELSAVTIGDKVCDNYLKTLYALGFEKAARIECEEELQFWPELTATLIAGYVSQKGGQQLIIMGRESAGGQNAKTPLLVAENLGWPCITQVTEIEAIDDTKIRVRNVWDGGICTRIVNLPCVLTVGDAPCSYLRIPTLKDRMTKGKKEIASYAMEDMGITLDEKEQREHVKLKKLTAVNQNRAGIIIEGASSKEMAQILYRTYLRERLMKL